MPTKLSKVKWKVTDASADPKRWRLAPRLEPADYFTPAPNGEAEGADIEVRRKNYHRGSTRCVEATLKHSARHAPTKRGDVKEQDVLSTDHVKRLSDFGDCAIRFWEPARRFFCPCVKHSDRGSRRADIPLRRNKLLPTPKRKFLFLSFASFTRLFLILEKKMRKEDPPFPHRREQTARCGEPTAHFFPYLMGKYSFPSCQIYLSISFRLYRSRP